MKLYFTLHPLNFTLFFAHGSHVEVLEPEWLREKVAQEMKDAVKKYHV